GGRTHGTLPHKPWGTVSQTRNKRAETGRSEDAGGTVRKALQRGVATPVGQRLREPADTRPNAVALP
ncbi:hypothetical protein AB4144_28030, partial [Rhizobiaceae sp. 2RAB30]